MRWAKPESSPVHATGARPVDRAARPSLVRRAGIALSGSGAGLLGLAPHILHHAGPLAGAALFGGLAGSLLFGALGLVAAIPFLLRMRRRSGGWRRSLTTLLLFAAVFSVATFVLGPALTGEEDGGSAAPRAPEEQRAPDSHQGHH